MLSAVFARTPSTKPFYVTQTYTKRDEELETCHLDVNCNPVLRYSIDNAFVFQNQVLEKVTHASVRTYTQADQPTLKSGGAGGNISLHRTLWINRQELFHSILFLSDGTRSTLFSSNRMLKKT